MCGFHIHGGKEMTLNTALSALRLTEHRGPDMSSHRIIQDETFSIFLGFNRLAINDLSSAGMQPMESINGRYICVLNGEIFNYKSLRKELLQKGYKFRNNTDTEVLLNGFSEWSESITNKLDGQYSFVIYDTLTKIIFACRDSFGEKPLYFSTNPIGSIVISSEKKCIPISLGSKPNINLSFIQDTLQEVFPYSREETIFNGVSQLNAGHSLTFNCLTKKLSISKYFSYQKNELKEENIEFDQRNSSDIFGNHLIQSLNERVPEEVPFTIALSGGVDSTLLASVLMKEPRFIGRKLQSAITFAFEENFSVNEISRTRELANFLNLNLIEVQSNIKTIIDYVSYAHIHYEEIIPGPSMLLEWELMRTAKELGYKVVLSGQGADELFGGYNYIIPHYLARGQNLHEIVQSTSNAIKWRHKFIRSGFVPPISKLEMIGKTVKSKALNIKDQKMNSKKLNSYTTLEKLLVNDLTRYSLPRNLYFGDRNGMAHGIEIRHPYLSRGLVELSQEDPYLGLLHEGYQKYRLRKYLSELTNPKFAFEPQKLGFEFPKEWMGNPYMKDWILERLNSSNIQAVLPIPKKEISKIAANFAKRPNKLGTTVWPFASAIELVEVFKN
jgi:asparagine synthase (glutamine-hydrolysing)